MTGFHVQAGPIHLLIGSIERWFAFWPRIENDAPVMRAEFKHVRRSDGGLALFGLLALGTHLRIGRPQLDRASPNLVGERRRGITNGLSLRDRRVTDARRASRFITGISTRSRRMRRKRFLAALVTTGRPLPLLRGRFVERQQGQPDHGPLSGVKVPAVDVTSGDQSDNSHLVVVRPKLGKDRRRRKWRNGSWLRSRFARSANKLVGIRKLPQS